jgi:hypothetical protein
MRFRPPPAAVRHAAACVLAAATFAARGARAQAPRDSLRGAVRDARGAPVVGANVFLLETLAGALTDSAGRFAVPDAPGPRTLVARRAGHGEVRRLLAPNTPVDRLTLVLPDGAPALAAVRVEAGRYSADGERGTTLTPLQVATAPGAAADVNRALQMLPGVQPVDEGDGLFVRGGDYTETRTFVDGAPLAAPVQLQRPAGTFAATVSPFLLDGIVFSTGGFGARLGDALSGVAELRTLGRPARRTATAGVGLAALSGAGAVPLPGGGGVRAAANRLDLAPLLRVNGSPRSYAPPPRGHDVSGSAHWRYGAAGEVRLFALRQTNALGLDDAGMDGAYALDAAGALAVLRWHDVVGRLAPTVTLSATDDARDEGYGAFQLDTRRRAVRAAAQAAWERSPALTLRAGAEVERTAAGFDGSVPASAADAAPGARVRVLASDVRGRRDALFAEGDWRPATRLRVIAGARTDRSTLTGRRTVDPRLSLAWTARPGATLTAAWGVYHQVPDALLFDPTLGVAGLPPMRATHAVVGAQLGEGDGAVLRVEAYAKRYADLAQQTRDYLVVPGGDGRARGADVFLRGALAFGVTGRASYSLVDAERTDPHTGARGSAPGDVTHALTAVAERRVGRRGQAAVAWRHATGRPIAPVLGADLDAASGRWQPRYGTLGDDRLPAFARLDANGSYLVRPAASLQLVAYAGLTNALGRRNVYALRHTADYRSRVPVPSLFNRAVYAGASLTRF